MAKTDYSWWKSRLVCASRFYQAYRIDHVLGFFRIWETSSRETTAMMRQGAGYNLRERFAVTGVWHNGGITTVHRLGFVGLGLVTLVFVMSAWVILSVCHALRGTPMYLPSLFLILPYVAQLGLFYISAGTIIKFFNQFVYIAMAKFFYCEAREQGLLMPLFSRQHYIPLAIQAYEERIRPAEP